MASSESPSVARRRLRLAVRAAKISRRRRTWWADHRFREHLTPPMRQVIRYEDEAAEATTIRHFSTSVIPSRLQNAAYAEAVLNSYRDELTDDETAVRLRARIRRRREFLDRKNPPQVLLLIDESMVRRWVGGPQTTGGQLAASNLPLPLFGSYEIHDRGVRDSKDPDGSFWSSPSRNGTHSWPVNVPEISDSDKRKLLVGRKPTGMPSEVPARVG